MKSFRIFSAYFFQFLKTQMSYRWDFIASIISGLFTSASGVIFVTLLINGSTIKSLQGWSKPEILFIYGFSLIISGIFGLFSRNLWRFGEKYIIEGQFDRVLLRPVSSLAQVVFEAFNLDAIGTILMGILLMVKAKASLGITFTFAQIAWLIFSIPCGAVTLLCVFITLASLSFHFEDRFGVVPPFYNLIQFGRYPVTIYNKVLQFLIQWIIPYSFIAFFPATTLIGRDEFWFYASLTPVVAVVWLFVVSFAWKLGVKKYESTGT